LQESYGEFDKRETMVIAIAQEDTDLPSHGKLVKRFQPQPKFKIAADVDGKTLAHYDRTTAYLIDKNGKIREIFPMPIHVRPRWEAILSRIDEIL
jgi:peroxiredoxin